MADADDSAPLSREEIERFERTRPVRWDRYSCHRPEPLWLLPALSLDCDPRWLRDVERNPRWRNHYWYLLEPATRRRQLITEFAILRNPEYTKLKRHQVLCERDEHAPYIRALAEHFMVPKQMTDAAARAVLVRAGVIPEALHVSVPPDRNSSAPQFRTSTRKGDRWSDAELRSLLAESAQTGVTQKVLADTYGVTRQRISALLKVAGEKFAAPNRASLFPTVQGKAKGTRY